MSISRKLLIAANSPKGSPLERLFHAEAMADLEAATRSPVPGEPGAAAHLFRQAAESKKGKAR